jgi:hypothetical protein
LRNLTDSFPKGLNFTDKNSEKEMKRLLTFWLIGLLMSIAGSQSVTKAALHMVVGGTAAPASTLGPYTVTPFAEDSRLTYQKYNFVESPLGGNVLFQLPLEHQKVTEGWATWSHDYSGDVYCVSDKTGSIFLVTLTLPENTTSFYFYAQPKQATVNTINVMAFDGYEDMIETSQAINGNAGACYFGFYGTDSSTIHNINIYSNAAFAIGEFGISTAIPSPVPVPGAFILSNIGLCTLIKLRKHRFFKKVT